MQEKIDFPGNLKEGRRLILTLLPQLPSPFSFSPFYPEKVYMRVMRSFFKEWRGICDIRVALGTFPLSFPSPKERE